MNKLTYHLSQIKDKGVQRALLDLARDLLNLETRVQKVERELYGDITKTTNSLSSTIQTGYVPYSYLNIPSNIWSGTNYYGLKDGAGQEIGGLIHNGGYNVGIQSNGYRNGDGTWTSLGAGAGASAVECRPDGAVYIKSETSKADGSSSQITDMAYFIQDGNVSDLRIFGVNYARTIYYTGTPDNATTRFYCGYANGNVYLDSYGGDMYYRSDTKHRFDQGGVYMYGQLGVGRDVYSGWQLAVQRDALIYHDSNDYIGLQADSSEKLYLRSGSGCYMGFRNRGSSTRKAYIGTSSSSNDNLYLYSDVNATIHLRGARQVFSHDTSTESSSQIEVRESQSGDYRWCGIGPQNSSYFHFYSNQPEYYFNKRCEASGGFGTYSDKRAKKNIEKRKDKYDRKSEKDKKVSQKLRKIDTYEYQYNKQWNGRHGLEDNDDPSYVNISKDYGLDERHVGFLAQELKDVFPEIVRESQIVPDDKVDEYNPADALSISYDGLFAVLVESIQELTEDIEQLQQEINTKKAGGNNA